MTIAAASSTNWADAMDFHAAMMCPIGVPALACCALDGTLRTSTSNWCSSSCSSRCFQRCPPNRRMCPGHKDVPRAQCAPCNRRAVRVAVGGAVPNVCASLRTYIHTYVCTYACACVCTYARMHVPSYTCYGWNTANDLKSGARQQPAAAGRVRSSWQRRAYACGCVRCLRKVTPSSMCCASQYYCGLCCSCNKLARH